MHEQRSAVYPQGTYMVSFDGLGKIQVQFVQKQLYVKNGFACYLSPFYFFEGSPGGEIRAYGISSAGIEMVEQRQTTT